MCVCVCGGGDAVQFMQESERDSFTPGSCLNSSHKNYNAENPEQPHVTFACLDEAQALFSLSHCVFIEDTSSPAIYFCSLLPQAVSAALQVPGKASRRQVSVRAFPRVFPATFRSRGWSGVGGDGILSPLRTLRPANQPRPPPPLPHPTIHNSWSLLHT